MMVKYKVKFKKYFSNIDWEKEKTKRFWFEDEPVITHFMNAISIAVPETERFLVRTTKEFLNELSEIKIESDMQVFIADENEHSLQHTRFNNDLRRHNYPVNFGLKFTKFGFYFLYKLMSKKTRLAMAVCFEHMTAVIAHYGFDNDVMVEGVSKVYDLFIWHAFEELNHKSTANELYTASGGGYIRRVLSMLFVTMFFIIGVLTIQSSFVFCDLIHRRGIKAKHFLAAFKFFFSRNGMVLGNMKYYFSIYKYHYVP